MGVRTNNRYDPIHNRPGVEQPARNGRQVPPYDPSPSNIHDVRFMENTTEPQTNEPPTIQAMPTEGPNQWPPHANVITYEIREVYEGTTHEALVLAVTTRAMRGNAQVENALEGQEEYSSDDVEPPHLPNLEKVASAARQAAKALGRGMKL